MNEWISYVLNTSLEENRLEDDSVYKSTCRASVRTWILIPSTHVNLVTSMSPCKLPDVGAEIGKSWELTEQIA